MRMICPECGKGITCYRNEFVNGLYINLCPKCGFNGLCEDDIVNWSDTY